MYQGGIYGGGSVFRLTPSSNGWTETEIYDFSGVNGDGAYPHAGVTFDGKGNLFGTTESGGIYTACYSGCGTVFELLPGTGGTWHERVLYRFADGLDGGFPYAPILIGRDGNLYGTVAAGGAGGAGAVFRVIP